VLSYQNLDLWSVAICAILLTDYLASLSNNKMEAVNTALRLALAIGWDHSLIMVTLLFIQAQVK
jgi:hypothetical protein